LALSVFPVEGSRSRFDFYAFKNEEWSLEHIFPQTPEGKGHNFTNDEKVNIRQLIGEKITPELDRLLKKDIRNPEEQLACKDAVKAEGSIDGIGNMCLLTKKNNSGLGCKGFAAKRNKILSFIQLGHFVPKHTFDVFAKMIKGGDPDLSQWSKSDIDAHATFIAKALVPNKEAG